MVDGAPRQVPAAGRNSVGKSTLLNSLIGLHSLTEGTVHLGGEPLDSLTPAGVPAASRTFRRWKVAASPTVAVPTDGSRPYIGLFSSPSRRDVSRCKP